MLETEGLFLFVFSSANAMLSIHTAPKKDLKYNCFAYCTFAVFSLFVAIIFSSEAIESSKMSASILRGNRKHLYPKSYRFIRKLKSSWKQPSSKSLEKFRLAFFHPSECNLSLFQQRAFYPLGMIHEGGSSCIIPKG